MLRRSSLRGFRKCSEKSPGFFDLRKFQRRRKAFERGGEDFAGFERAAGRMIELRQRQRRTQLKRTRALFAGDGDGDGRLRIAAGAIRIGGRTEKPRLAADAEQLGLLPAACDVAVSVHPQERVLLRQGIRVIREHIPKSYA
jgi:hypothetical protein